VTNLQKIRQNLTVNPTLGAREATLQKIRQSLPVSPTPGARSESLGSNLAKSQGDNPTEKTRRQVSWLVLHLEPQRQPYREKKKNKKNKNKKEWGVGFNPRFCRLADFQKIWGVHPRRHGGSKSALWFIGFLEITRERASPRFSWTHNSRFPTMPRTRELGGNYWK
jgi:hypothetical protein